MARFSAVAPPTLSSPAPVAKSFGHSPSLHLLPIFPIHPHDCRKTNFWRALFLLKCLFCVPLTRHLSLFLDFCSVGCKQLHGPNSSEPHAPASCLSVCASFPLEPNLDTLLQYRSICSLPTPQTCIRSCKHLIITPTTSLSASTLPPPLQPVPRPIQSPSYEKLSWMWPHM